MSIFKKRTKFRRAAEILASEGFTDNYIDTLKEELEKAGHKKDIAVGRNYLANALLIRGKLTESYSVFEKIELKDLDRSLHGNLISNMIFCKFVQNEFKAADELYKTYNDVVLGEHSEAMKRSLAIHEHISGRYENAVEIIVKMGDSKCRFIDICIVKSLIRLDMYERAEEFAKDFPQYKDCGELYDEVKKLTKKIRENLYA